MLLAQSTLNRLLKPMSSERWTADAASSSKRRKVSLDTISDSDAEPYDFTMGARDRAVVTQEPTSKSLSRPITPPPSKRSQSEPIDSLGLQRKQKRPVGDLESASIARKDEELPSPDSTFLPSQFQLTRIKDLSSAQNVDTIGLGDILGDPLIKQCWNFNFLFDLDFVM
jgi:tyrosyl-DNA phosphodiesterase-1